MLHSIPLLPAFVATSRWGRVLAGAQGLKETLFGVVLVLPVVLARPFFLLTSLPALVLYGLHGAMAMGWLRRRTVGVVWVLTLIEEVWSWLVQEMADTGATRYYLARVSFGLGLAISVLALMELGWRWRHRRLAVRRNVRHQARADARPS